MTHTIRNAYRLVHGTAAALLVAAVVVLSACGPRVPPLLSVEQGELGVYNALPTFVWTAGSEHTVTDAVYSLDGGETWVPVGASVNEFRPDAPLPAGLYTVAVRYHTWSGWSVRATADFTVQEITGYEPNDTYYVDYQWALPLIDMPLAWGLLDALFPDRPEVVVAVIDTGYLDHPDLLANIDPLLGYDFIGPDPDDTPDDTSDDTYVTANDGNGIDIDAHDAGDDDGYGNSWHGTSVAGTIAAVTDNASGVAGLAREKVTIMPLRVLGVGGGYTYDIAQALLYAAGLPNDSGIVPATTAKIANLSLGGGGLDPYMEQVLQDVTAAGLVVVAATGNDSDDPQWVGVGYPASSPYTIAAGSVGEFSETAYYSQMGAQLDVVAPGGDLSLGGEAGVLLPSADESESYPPSTYLYAFIQGTSFACPHVAGALAVMAMIDPALDLATARDLFRFSSSNLDEPLAPGLFHVGVLNMASLIETHLGGRIATSMERPLFSWTGGPAGATSGSAADSHEPPPPISVGGMGPGEKQTMSLIVQLAGPGAPGRRSLERMSGVRSVRGSGDVALVRLEPGMDLEAARAALLADPAVRAVYYNYRYWPL